MMRIILFLFVILLCLGCNKNSFLEENPDKSRTIPTTFEDFQAILDNDAVMNGGKESGAPGVDPNFQLTFSDEFFIPSDEISPNQIVRDIYTMNDNIDEATAANWDRVYKAIFSCNVVLDGLTSMNTSQQNTQTWRNLKGAALFYRARYFASLAQVFSLVYNNENRNSNLGIVFRTSSDIYEKVKRASLKETYELILNDLILSSQLLQNISSSPYKTRPAKAAAFAMLAKIYLSIGQYDNSKKYADSCLAIQNTLIDFNQLIPKPTLESTEPSINRLNGENIFHSILFHGNIDLTNFNIIRVDTTLFDLYNINDLRKTTFFYKVDDKNIFFKGSYDGSNAIYSGIAVDEIYLVRAEANARIGAVQAAMNDLNTLMIKRWSNNGSWVPFTANTKEAALQIILRERRKELVFRGIRWFDQKRLNLEGANITVTRTLNGTSYQLQPNDKRYLFLLPQSVIGFNPTMQQNPR